MNLFSCKSMMTLRALNFYICQYSWSYFCAYNIYAYTLKIYIRLEFTTKYLIDK